MTQNTIANCITQYHIITYQGIFSHFDYVTCQNFLTRSVHKAVRPISGRVASTVTVPVSSQVQFLLFAECTMYLAHVVIVLLSDYLQTMDIV